MDANQIKQTIGQIEKSISDAGTVLKEEEFSDYCDNAYKLISKWRQLLMKKFFE